MKEYIENILHQDVPISPYPGQEKLPLVLRRSCDISMMNIGGQAVLLAAMKERLPLVDLRKHYNQITVYTELPCVLYLKEMNYYFRDAMIREGIPFVWEGHQIYLPFMGTLLDDHQRKAITTCAQISYLTQRLLLTALYQGWQKVTVTQAAKMLNVSKMSITRCFDELEALHVQYLIVRNQARNISADINKKAMWENIQGILRSPVITWYALKEAPEKLFPLGGISALAHYSMLDGGTCPILAMTKKDLSETVQKNIPTNSHA